MYLGWHGLSGYGDIATVRVETYVGLGKKFLITKNVCQMKRQRAVQPYPLTIVRKKTLKYLEHFMKKIIKKIYHILNIN